MCGHLVCFEVPRSLEDVSPSDYRLSSPEPTTR